MGNKLCIELLTSSQPTSLLNAHIVKNLYACMYACTVHGSQYDSNLPHKVRQIDKNRKKYFRISINI